MQYLCLYARFVSLSGREGARDSSVVSEPNVGVPASVLPTAEFPVSSIVMKVSNDRLSL